MNQEVAGLQMCIRDSTLLAEAEATVDKIEKMYKRGFISDDERYERVIATWTKTTDCLLYTSRCV